MSNSFLIDKLELANIKCLEGLYECKTMKLKGACFLWNDILPERFCNLAVAIRSNQNNAPKLIKQISKKFKEKGIKPGFQTTPATRPKEFANSLISLGFEKSYSESWMIYNRKNASQKFKKAEIIKIQTASQMRDFVELFNSFGNNLPQSERMDRAYESVIWDSFKKKQQKRKVKHYLAVLNQKPVGFGTLVVTQNCASIYNVGVLEPFRERGIGSTLVNRLISDATKLEIKNIFLQTNLESLAQRFFKKRGFEVAFVSDVFEKAQGK